MAQQQWSNDEKNYLLAEIIKANSPPPNVLFNVIYSLGIRPRWDDIPLPLGRSLSSCRQVYEDIQRSSGPYFPQPPHVGPVSQGPWGPPRHPEVSYPPPRQIRPKPLSVPPQTYNQPSEVNQGTVKRKRGRPTKASQQAARALEEAQRRGEPSGTSSMGPTQGSPPFVPAQGSPQVSIPRTSPSLPQQASPQLAQPPPRTEWTSVPITTRMPISSMLTPTAPATKSASHSGSSSGKRKRGKSTRTEPEGQGQASGYDSPYGRPPPGEREEIVPRSADPQQREETTPSYEPRMAPRQDP